MRQLRLFGAYLILLAVVLLGARVMGAQYGETDTRPWPKTRRLAPPRP